VTQLFQCPSCNAPLEYDGVKSLVGCPYCGNNVIVPETLRPRSKHTSGDDEGSSGTPFPKRDIMNVLQTIQQMARNGQKIQAIRLFRDAFGATLEEARSAVESLAAGNTINPPPISAPFGRVYRQNPQQVLLSYEQPAGRGCWRAIVWLVIIGVIIATIVIFAAPAMLFRAVTPQIPPIIDGIRSEIEIPLLPSATPTPGFAISLGQFGSEGVGPGRFNDARGIALSNDGRVYVSEYSTGRIQVFEEDGTFVTQWTIPDASYINNIAVDRNGVLVAPIGGRLQEFAANNGQPFGAIAISEVEDAQDTIHAMPDGGWLTVLDDDIVRLNSASDEVLRISDAFANATGSPEMLPIVAADGLGNIYALGRFANVILKFDADGRYITRFGGRAAAGEDAPGTLNAPYSIAVDGDGRVLVGDIFGIQVFDGDGRFQGIIDTEGFPFGVAVHDDGRIFAIERDHVAVYRLNE
jgi:DNA-directed RNA polymerase subunit RPC12/RpoP